MKKLLTFTICFLSILSQERAPLEACGNSDDYAVYSIFAPEVIGEQDADYFRTLYNSIKVGESDHKNLFKINNTDLWYSFFEKNIPKEDLDTLLYGYRISQIDELIFTLKGLKKTQLKNKVLNVRNKSKAKSFLYYVGFAKRCEGVNRQQYYWGDEQEGILKPNEVEKLIKAGLANFKANKFKTLKERYIMQLTRLHFALGLDEKKKSQVTGLNAHEFYVKYQTQITPKSTTDLRAKAYAAGHLKRIGQIAQSNLLYAQLHQNGWMKSIGQIGFKVQDPKAFRITLHLANSPQDKISLWKLQGLELDGLSAMKAIYDLNPAAPELNVLLMRAVNMQEENLDYYLKYSHKLHYDGEKDEYAYPTQNFDSLEHVQIYTFIKKVADNGNTHQPFAWDLAVGYLSALQGKKALSKTYLAKAQRAAPNETLIKEQIRLLGLINNLENHEKLDRELTGKLLPDLKWVFKYKHHTNLRTDFAKLYIRKKLSYIHYNSKRPLLAHCTSPFYEKGFYTKANNLNQMIALLGKKNKTDWEEFMISIYQNKKGILDDVYIWQYYAGGMDLNQLYYMKGLIYTYQSNYDKAIAEFEKTKDINSVFGVDVFDTHIYDCSDCDNAEFKGKGFTSVQLVQKQKEIAGQIAMGKNLANNYFKLANSYYNISYYGNNRAFYRETKLVRDNPTYRGYYSSENFNTSPLYFLYDNQLSLKYYLLASQHSNDPEFKAKCHFMAAKCERNTWYSSHQDKAANEFPGGIYFGLLKKNFSHTQYYQEIIAECGYFESYVKR